MKERKFEYRVFEEELYKQPDGSYESLERTSILNRFGKAGWELVSTEKFNEHISKMSTDPDEIINEDGEIDYIDTGRKTLLEYDLKKVVFFFKREITED